MRYQIKYVNEISNDPRYIEMVFYHSANFDKIERWLNKNYKYTNVRNILCSVELMKDQV